MPEANPVAEMARHAEDELAILPMIDAPHAAIDANRPRRRQIRRGTRQTDDRFDAGSRHRFDDAIRSGEVVLAWRGLQVTPPPHHALGGQCPQRRDRWLRCR